MRAFRPSARTWVPAAVVGAVVVGAVVAGSVGAAVQPSDKPAAKAPASPAPAAAAQRTPGYNPERNAYFGDLHVHTALSNDAYIFNVRLMPDDAYRFARGEAIGHASGYQIRLAGGPLDFVAVTDHAEYLAAVREGADPNSPLSKLPFAKQLMATDPAGIQRAFTVLLDARQSGNLPKEFTDPAIGKRAWDEIQRSAARHYQPGRFTTFVGYEFTSAPDARNLHRNVIFRTEKVPALPYSANDSRDPEDLWRAMDGWRARGIEALAIPHNANGSDGLMFDKVRLNGQPFTREYAELRIRNEPLVEITQIKGASETHPTLSMNDEFANFEIMDTYIGRPLKVTRFQGSYVRRALQDGLAFRDELGANPFKLGFVSGSDTHNAAPGSVEEPNYFSKTGKRDGLPEQRLSVPPDGKRTWDDFPAPDPKEPARPPQQAWGAAGLAAVWAEENTRESIYAALRRKETFATSGPRIKVRFFAGYGLPDDLDKRADAVKQAYAKATPMGGDLQAQRSGAPRFLVMAVRDPNAGYLQRAQIVKGWVENGIPKERIFDVACSDGLKVGANGRCPDNGAKVDLKTCQPDRFKGDVALSATWTDPTWNPKQRAFYYVRVLENPSCRWSTWDALRNGTPPNPHMAATIMERAWSSPIWVEPAA